VWSEQDSAYTDVIRFLSQAEEVSDFTAVDYLLRDYVPKARWGALVASCHILESRTNTRFTVEVKMARAIVEGSNGFSIGISKSTPQHRDADNAERSSAMGISCCGLKINATITREAVVDSVETTIVVQVEAITIVLKTTHCTEEAHLAATTTT
jgi:hypothetical protein